MYYKKSFLVGQIYSFMELKKWNCIFTVFNHEEHMVNEHPLNQDLHVHVSK